ncbi:MAG: phosphoribosylanthranilate isomerase [Candidatus Omnitrophota bacterium]|jgi:phosphoribosylanthranilate isomerase|nr:MAG: phosphoribosylanthranilate isomerase [Candidatus Omnitrophota bacterium]
MVKIKICGITNIKDALDSIRLGAHALGFVFYKKSPRYIRPIDAKSIIERLPSGIMKVGVFVGGSRKSIKNILRSCKLDALQLHGGQTPQFCRGFKGYRVIKCLKVRKAIDKKEINRYNVYALLFDTFDKDVAGGTGRRFDWKLLKGIPRNNKLFFLSGGLTAGNVGLAIKIVRPDWVDVSSSLESRPGKKDAARVRRFINAVKRTKI